MEDATLPSLNSLSRYTFIIKVRFTHKIANFVDKRPKADASICSASVAYQANLSQKDS